MPDDPQSQIHPSVLTTVHQLYPERKRLSAAVWRRIAAFASDDYREQIEEPEYQQLLELKLKYAVQGDSYALQRALSSLKGQLSLTLLDLGDRDRDAVEFVWKETKAFVEAVDALGELPRLESLVLKSEGAELGKNLRRASPRERSQAFAQMLQNDLIEWQGLPNALMRFVVAEFADRARVDPFWQRLQRNVGSTFKESLLNDENYRELLRLQIRHAAFCEKAASITPLAETLAQRLGQPGELQKPSTQQILQWLNEFREDLQRPPSQRGHY